VGERHSGPRQAHAGLFSVSVKEQRARGLGAAVLRRAALGSESPGHLEVPRTLSVDAWSCREERESWIRAKYEQLLFLAPLGTTEGPLGHQLWAAVQAQDVAAVL
jgi:hypothetical protein